MKSLVLWSSRTGNTKAVAEAIFEALPGEKEIMEEGREGNDLSSYDLVFVGFWGYRRGADPLAQKTLSSLFGKHVAIYATAGTWPDSEAAKMYLANAAALLPEDATCLGTFICQGRVNSFHQKKLAGLAQETAHEMTPERLARLEEAEKHPNEEDFARAKAWAKEMADLVTSDW